VLPTQQLKLRGAIFSRPGSGLDMCRSLLFSASVAIHDRSVSDEKKLSYSGKKYK
jgi:hypothetical protein